MEWRREVLPISHLSIRLVVVVILQKSICMLYNNISHLVNQRGVKRTPPSWMLPQEWIKNRSKRGGPALVVSG